MSNLDIFTPHSHHDKIPMVEGIHAGFPSPAEDYTEPVLDLNRYVIKNPASTFYARISGDSMVGVGIQDGDIVVIDKSLEPANDQIAVCFIDGEFTLKRIHTENGRLFLMPHNPNFPSIEITEENNFQVWGIVTYIIKKM
ncbi:MAG: translesion error-prone DNA polymerase V autoproteolytic subunit [Bacteroidales bacterium]|jgi:DNA polymerase V|nr:translesion error-prone DNA polymerase V autoproteolytic subunit [Bacteroidales bacterium]